MEADFDIGDGGEGGATGILSIRSIGAFFTGFGWSGAAALQNGLATGAATFIGTIVGSIFLGLIVYLMSYLHSLREEGTLNYKNCIGEVGTVYLPIPPARKGMGQIDEAIIQLDEELAWRKIAAPAVLPFLQGFEEDVRMTIGLRAQDRLPDYLVPQISRCRSKHRDISLNF